MAAVVTAFLLGLGAGARYLGRLADRLPFPLWTYGLCEVAIGVLALLIPLEVSWLSKLSTSSYSDLQGHPLVHSIIRFAFTLPVLGPPCFLMGGTLPLLIRQFSTAPDAGLDRSTAWLYAINTLGAATGCYLAGFHLLPTLGLHRSNLLCAVSNITIGAVAMAAGRSASVEEPRFEGLEPRGAPPASRTDGTLSRRLHAAAALTGCGALMLQVVWNRQLALILGGSTYAFTAMLFVILLGIGGGSLAIHSHTSRGAALRYAPGIVILFVAATTLMGQSIISPLSGFAGVAGTLRASQAFNAILSVATSAGLELLPALGMGVLFPLFVHLMRGASTEAGSIVGGLYAWNTFGTTLGASLTPLLLLPVVGTARTVDLALALYAVALFLVFPRRSRLDDAFRLLVSGLAVAFLAYPRAAHDPRITNSGMYMYGYKEPAALLSESRLLYFHEGHSANVMVTENGRNRLLRVNGKIDASTQRDMQMQLGLAYLPRFLRPAAGKVLVIGFGSGTTPGASLLFPDTDVTCSEIEPGVFAAAEHFSPVNHDPQASPRFSIVFDDGRSHLQGAREKYDVILSEPSNPWMAGVSNLFTEEFYRSARDGLREGGVLAQWVQVYSFSVADYALVVRTLTRVFPYARLIRISEGDTILLASASPIGIDAQTVRAAQALVDSLPAVRSDLMSHFGSTDVLELLMTHLLLDPDGLQRLLASEPSSVINTDRNLRLEFDAPRSLFRPTDDPEQDVMRAILSAVDPAELDRAFESMGGEPRQASVFHRLANTLLTRGLADSARRIVDLGIGRNPLEKDLLGDKLVLSEVDSSTFDGILSTIVSISEAHANAVGVTLWSRRKYRQAEAIFRRLLVLHPQSATAWNNLALTHQALGEREQALDAFRKAISFDPLNDAPRKSYEALLQQVASTP